MNAPLRAVTSGSDPFADALDAESLELDADRYPNEEKPVRWAVPRLMLCPGRPALALGRDGIGKTMFVQAIAVSVRAGIGALLGILEAAPPLRVRHCDVDQGIGATRRRYRRIAAGLGVPDVHVPIFDLGAMRPFDPRKAHHWVRVLEGFDLVIVDCFAALVSLFGGDENSTKDTRPVLDAMRRASEETECAIWLIAHTGRDLVDQKSRRSYAQRDPRGSSAIKQGAGAIWLFTGSVERGSERFVERTRDAADDDGAAEPIDAFRFRISELEGTVTPGFGERAVAALAIERTDAETASPFTEEAAPTSHETEIADAADAANGNANSSPRDRVVSFLRDTNRAVTVEEIKKAARASGTTVGRVLDGLPKRHLSRTKKVGGNGRPIEAFALTEEGRRAS